MPPISITYSDTGLRTLGIYHHTEPRVHFQRSLLVRPLLGKEREVNGHYETL